MTQLFLARTAPPPPQDCRIKSPVADFVLHALKGTGCAFEAHHGTSDANVIIKFNQSQTAIKKQFDFERVHSFCYHNKYIRIH